MGRSGASSMITRTMMSMASPAPRKKVTTASRRFPVTLSSAKPKTSANTTSGSIAPSLAARIGFVGTMSTTHSLNRGTFGAFVIPAALPPNSANGADVGRRSDADDEQRCDERDDRHADRIHPQDRSTGLTSFTSAGAGCARTRKPQAIPRTSAARMRFVRDMNPSRPWNGLSNSAPGGDSTRPRVFRDYMPGWWITCPHNALRTPYAEI